MIHIGFHARVALSALAGSLLLAGCTGGASAPPVTPTASPSRTHASAGTGAQYTYSPPPSTSAPNTPAADVPKVPPVDTAPAVPRTGAPSPAEVLAALQKSGVKLVVEDGWDREWDLASRQKDWQPIGVMLHHTGNANGGVAPSLDFLLNYQSPLALTRYDGLTGGSRGAALVAGRDGTMFLLRATRGPHAGTGGPMTIGGVNIPADDANGYFYGIEIESAGQSSDVHASVDETDGFSTAQVEAVGKVSAALLELLGRDETFLTDHKAWASEAQGKPDLIGNSVETFRAEVKKDLGR